STRDWSSDVCSSDLKVKQDITKQRSEEQQQQINFDRQKTDLVFYKISKGISLTIGFGLFISSFFVYSIDAFIGGTFFGTGLGARSEERRVVNESRYE